MVNDGAEVRFAARLARGLAAGALIAGLTMAGGARAQSITDTTVVDPSQFFGYDIPNDYERGRNVSVLDRPHPDYDPLGIRFHSWTVLPRLQIGPGYVSNVFGSQNNVKGSLTAVEIPSVTSYLDTGTIYSRVDAGLRLRQYVSQSSADETGAFLSYNIRGTIDRDDSINAGLYLNRGYIEPDSSFYPANAESPIAYNNVTALIGGSHQSERWKFVGALNAFASRYESAETQTGGKISEGYLDQTTVRGTGRVEYGWTPETALYAQVSAADTSYRLGDVRGSPERDSHEFRILAGGTFDLSHLARGTIGVGYVDREYDSSFYGALSGVSADARIEYFPTQLTTVTGDAQRLVQDSASLDGSPGYFANVVSVRVDQEVLRNFIVSATVRGEYDDYKVISREDKIGEFGVGARYLLTREVGLQADFAYVKRDSSGTFNVSLDDARLTLAVILRK